MISGHIHRHAGRPAVALGGGASLPLAFIPYFNARAIPANALLIDANDHGCTLARTGLIRTPDYIASVDRIEGRLRAWKVPIVSGRNFADIRLPDLMAFQAGMTAAYVAWVFGCAPIILAGMDCYHGGTYWHEPKGQSSGLRQSVKEHLKRWENIIPVCPGAQFRALNSPLDQLFPPYDPDEPPQPADAAEIRDRLHGQFKRVRLLRAWMRFKAGAVLELPEREAANFVHGGRAVRA